LQVTTARAALRRILGAALVSVLVMTVAANADPQVQTPGAWRTVAPLPGGGVDEIEYGTVLNGRLYMIGGLQGSFAPLGRVYEYDAASNHWARKHDMPRALHHVMPVSLNGKIYVFGGFANMPEKPGYVPTADAWEYSPDTDAWRALAPMPTPRGAGGAVAVEGRIFVLGGAGMRPPSAPAVFGFSGAHAALDAVEEYVPATNSWIKRRALPTPRNHFAALGAVNGKIYAIGGRTGSVFIRDADQTDLVEIYDIAKDQWGALGAHMPVARSGGCFGVYNDEIYAYGGEYRDDHLVAAFREFDVYNPASNEWRVLPYGPVQRHGCSAGFIGNTFYVAGGTIESGGAIAGVDIATPQVDAYDVKAATK
jgi:N-acetylneuraminic acid mutarotase